jgi:hypothetical protein
VVAVAHQQRTIHGGLRRYPGDASLSIHFFATYAIGRRHSPTRWFPYFYGVILEGSSVILARPTLSQRYLTDAH